MLTGEVQKETKRLIPAWCEREGMTLLAIETDKERRFHPVPWNGTGLPAPVVKNTFTRGGSVPFPNV